MLHAGAIVTTLPLASLPPAVNGCVELMALVVFGVTVMLNKAPGAVAV
jgi:hypothetical protein